MDTANVERTEREGRVERSGVRAMAARPGSVDAEALVARLRGSGDGRPAVDPGLAGGLRDWLEDSLAPYAESVGDSDRPVRVTKEKIQRVLSCEAHAVALPATDAEVSFELARGSLVDALFRQWVTVGSIADPMGDAVDALAAVGDEKIVGFVRGLGGPQRGRMVEELEDHAANITSSWPVLSGAWLGRTQERIEVPLAGGTVVLGGVIDLVLGGPSAGQASVCLVEMKSGARRLEHRGDLHFYALLETLRAGAPPFRVATYYSATCELDAERVGDDVLIGALHRVVPAVQQLCRLASGAEPARTPNPLCAWCSELPGCGPGQERTGASVPKAAGKVRDDYLMDGVGLEEEEDEV